MLDVRNPNEFQIGRIPGTVLIPLPELPQRLAELPRDREILVHCKSGMRSAKAVQFLKENGFGKAVNIQGGILAWSERIRPIRAEILRSEIKEFTHGKHGRMEIIS